MAVGLATTVLAWLTAVLCVVWLGQAVWSLTYWRRRGVVSAMLYSGVSELYRRVAGQRFVGVYRGLRPALLVREPELVKAVLGEAMGRCGEGEAAGALAGNVFNAEGEAWRGLRGCLTPCFTPGSVRRMMPGVSQHARALANALQPCAAEGRLVALKTPLLAYGVDTASAALFGVGARALDAGAGVGGGGPDSQLLRMVQALEEDPSAVHAFAGGCAPWPLQGLRKGSTGRAALEAFFGGLAKELLEAEGAGRRNDLVQRLARLGADAEQASERERCVAAHVASLLLAAAHKPSALVCCALWELAAQPLLQQQLREELKEAEEPLGAPLLDAVVLETLRLHPAEAVLSRVPRRPWQLPGGEGLTLEANTRLLLPVAALHRDTALCPRPADFLPARFLRAPAAAPAAAAAAPAVFLPFGAGPRKCVGYRLGVFQTKAALAELLSRFHFAPAPPSRTSTPEDPSLVVTLVREKSVGEQMPMV